MSAAASRVRATCFATALLLLSGMPAAFAERKRPAAPPKTPQKNFSDIYGSVEWVQRAFADAHRAAQQEDWPTAVRKLQTVVDAVEDRETPGRAAPYVRSVRGRRVYEGAWLVAHHERVRWGAACMQAYELEYGARARAEVQAALQRGRLGRLVTLARQFLPLKAGRTAALVLADLALERGAHDEALEWVELLEDLEVVSREPEDTLAAWREARIARHARALADPGEAQDAVRASLTERARQRDEPGQGLEVVPFTQLARATEPRHWPATGGNAARNAVPASLGHAFRLAWYRSPTVHDDLADSVDPKDGGKNRASTWLPPRGIVMPAGLFVSDGTTLHLYDLEKGEPRALRRFQHAVDVGHDVDDDRRERFGWIEGHALTGRVDDEGTTWIYAAAPDGAPFEWSRANHEPENRNDRLEAVTWDGRMLTSRWIAGGLFATNGMSEDVRLYGAPVLYRDKLWIAGVRPSGTSSDRWEAWMYALDPDTGDVLLQTHLGTGTPVRPVRQDEAMPSSPAAARGRVVVSTNLGIVAAVDARDGRLRWAFRNDRDIQAARRLRGQRSEVDEMARGSSFSNEPPILAGERCYVTPLDGQMAYVLWNRPRGTLRDLSARAMKRDEAFHQFEAEAVAGVVAHPKDGTPMAIFVGQGDDRAAPAPVAVARDIAPPDQRWSAPATAGLGASTYGRALVTRREVFVPTRGGIEVLDLATGDLHTLLNLKAVPKDVREDLPRPYGNLVPVPGKGFVAISATSIAFWAAKR